MKYNSNEWIWLALKIIIKSNQALRPDCAADVERKTRPKKTGMIDVQLPRNIMSSPLVTAALDRTNTPDLYRTGSGWRCLQTSQGLELRQQGCGPGVWYHSQQYRQRSGSNGQTAPSPQGSTPVSCLPSPHFRVACQESMGGQLWKISSPWC